MFCFATLQARAENAQLHVTAVGSRSSTEAAVTTVVQEPATIDPGALSHPTMIETRNGATVLNVRFLLLILCVIQTFHTRKRIVPHESTAQSLSFEWSYTRVNIFIHKG